MIAATDVQYFADGHAIAACVLFESWDDAAPTREWTVRIEDVAEYVPGQFYKRELPCLLALLTLVLPELTTIIVDGYVWLGDESHPGLGGHLFAALDRKIPVVGVAKTRFVGAAPVLEVLRGESASPLFVSAVGYEIADAAKNVQAMHGAHRLPTLLKRVDALCRART
ncbi:endonuclease V [Armatimonas sp.]|uniref:endonuclease V n=1 Tax=Armatimonas sp. TaxID=1872638 RepID=UPI00286D14CF|nr:endonuclease V [Armatimonas sp.]